MTWTKAQWVEETVQVADAKNDPRWSATTTLLLLGAVHLREWRRLLDHKHTLRMQTLAVTRDASGRVAWSDLSTGSADAMKSVHRVLAVYDGAQWYDFEEWRLSPLAGNATDGGADRAVWRREGDYLQVAPAVAGALSVMVSHLPTAINLLSTNATPAEWPDSFEHVIVFEAASRMLRKGGAETEASNELAALASQFREDMFSALGRETIEPRQMLLGDDPASWGG